MLQRIYLQSSCRHVWHQLLRWTIHWQWWCMPAVQRSMRNSVLWAIQQQLSQLPRKAVAVPNYMRGIVSSKHLHRRNRYSMRCLHAMLDLAIHHTGMHSAVGLCGLALLWMHASFLFTEHCVPGPDGVRTRTVSKCIANSHLGSHLLCMQHLQCWYGRQHWHLHRHTKHRVYRMRRLHGIPKRRRTDSVPASHCVSARDD